MPVFDLDPLSSRWVIHAPARSARPRPASAPPDEGCPFCPGNEHATPPELLRVGDDDGWSVRVFPNRFPAVDASEEAGDERGPVVGALVSGAHEVFVLSRAHDATFGDLDDAQSATVLDVVAARVEHHRGAGRPYVQPFINQGAAAGATIEHPHGQLLALDMVPPAVEREERVLASGACPLCGLVGTDATVAVREGLVVACPPWATGPFEMVLGPSEHVAFDRLHADRAGPLLRDALLALRAAAGEVAYNVGLHTSRHHWHMHVSPRTTVAGGFELASGMRINPSSPSEDARRLAAAWPA